MLNTETGPHTPHAPSPPSPRAPSPQKARQNPDKVTLVLFKDHHPPRSFEITLSWFKRTGTILGAIVLVAALSLAAALRVGWIARSSRPQALEQLKEENRNLRTMSESLEKQIQTLQAQAQLASESASTEAMPTASTAASPTPSASRLAETQKEAPSAATLASPTAPATAAREAPTQSLTETAPAPKPRWWDQARELWSKFTRPAQPPTQDSQIQSGASGSAQTPSSTARTAQSASSLLGHWFLPARSWPQPSQRPAELKIALTPPQVQLKNSRLQVKFAIQYTADDGKNQQGRIVLLARGPSGILAYPEGVLNEMGAETLLAPERGEFFSVGRYREVINEFDLPQTNPSQWKEVEVLIFQSDETLLLRERIDITESLRGQAPTGGDRAKSRPAPTQKPKSETSGADSDTVISPGTDR